MKKQGFTLAEVLITLGIIGVVAALTIPTLMANSQNRSYTVALRKNYSAINQALTMLTNEMGCTGDLVCTGLFSKIDSNLFGDEFVKHFKVLKNCRTNTGQNCMANNVSTYYDTSAPPGGVMFDENFGYKFITSDGASIYLAGQPSLNCDTNLSLSGTGAMTKVCGFLLIDVNGPKKPNIYGRDFFSFHLTNGAGPQIYPQGGPDEKPVNIYAGWWKDPATGNAKFCCPTNAVGSQCTGRVMEEGWEMNY